MSGFAFDPVLGHASAAALAIVLLVGAWQKFADRDAFQYAVERYRLLPQAGARMLAWTLPPAEALAAGLLLAPSSRSLGALLAAALILAVSAAVVLNLLRGHTDIDCGCGGSTHRQQLSWALVVRNLLLLVACALAGSPEAPRELVWLDALTAVFTALALWAVYLATNELFSDAKRFASGARAFSSHGSES